MKKILMLLICVMFIFGCTTVDKKQVAAEYLTEVMLQSTGYYDLKTIIAELETLEDLKSENKITDKEYKAKQEDLLKALDEFSKKSEVTK